MTNQEIIFKEAINNKVYTEAEAIEIIKAYGELPIHTFAHWKEAGYTVKKGEHAKITTKLWKYRANKKKAEESAENEDEVKANYYMCKAFLFTFDQVEKIQEKAG